MEIIKTQDGDIVRVTVYNEETGKTATGHYSDTDAEYTKDREVNDLMEKVR
ncbi:MAG: hypothetical protein K2J51_05395 [Alistipes sp.]|nr:hypothetical protein [Alistipes sp.]MDE6778882.1 hypothetical protein [Alistipes sp.]